MHKFDATVTGNRESSSADAAEDHSPKAAWVRAVRMIAEKHRHQADLQSKPLPDILNPDSVDVIRVRALSTQI